MRQTVSCPFEIKELSTDKPGEFTGYANVYNVRDLQGDVVKPGAFAKSLSLRNGKVKLLIDHDPSKRAGVVYLEETDRGLFVRRGVLNLDKQIGRELYAEMKQGLEHGLPVEMSIGYDVKNSGSEAGARTLVEVDVWEVSAVCWAANPLATVVAVKSLDEADAADLVAALQVKVGRMLSAVNETTLKDAMAAMSAAVDALAALIAANNADKSHALLKSAVRLVATHKGVDATAATKMEDGAETFVDALAEILADRKVDQAASEFYDYVWALQRAVVETLRDPASDQAAIIRQSLSQFVGAIESALPFWVMNTVSGKAFVVVPPPPASSQPIPDDVFGTLRSSIAMLATLTAKE